MTERLAEVIPLHPRRAREGEDWITKKELAKKIGMSERWIELQLPRGLPSCIFGKRARRFRLSEVEAWLRRRSA